MLSTSKGSSEDPGFPPHFPPTNFQILKHQFSVGWRKLLCGTWTASSEVGSGGDLAEPAFKHGWSVYKVSQLGQVNLFYSSLDFIEGYYAFIKTQSPK